mgnify:CR=1 FL=1
MSVNELKDLWVQERASAYLMNSMVKGQEDIKKSEEFIQLIKDTVTDSQEAEKLQAAFGEYLDWTAANSSEQEGLYLFGVADGLYLASLIGNIIDSVK